jgi:hypothetical protein
MTITRVVAASAELICFNREDSGVLSNRLAPVGSAGQGQASTESAPSSSAKQHLQGIPALGGSQAPVGATGQGQASTKNGSGGSDKSHLAGALRTLVSVLDLRKSTA